MSDVFVRIKTEYENSGIAKADKALGGLLSTIGKGSIVLATFALAANKAFEFGQQGAQIARLEASGKSLASSYGANMSTMLAAMQKTSQGTIASTDLILSANKAMMLGVTADAEQMANLLEVAALRGRAMGLSTSQAFNDIVTGIGRMSPLILDNLGIVTNMEARVREYADANGIAAESVDDATKKQILLGQVLEDGNKQLKEHGGLVYDTAAAYEKFGAQSEDAWNRVKISFGEFIEPLVSGLADGLERTNDLADAQTGLNATMVWGKRDGDLYNQTLYDVNGRLLTGEELLKEYQYALTGANFETERAAMLHGILFPQVAETGKAFWTAGQAMEFYNGVNTNLNSTIDSTIEKMKLEAVGITGLEDSFEGIIANFLNTGMAIHSLEANLEGTRAAAILADRDIGKIGDDETREQLGLLGFSLEEINRLLQLISGTYNIDLALNLIGRFGLGAEAILNDGGAGARRTQRVAGNATARAGGGPIDPSMGMVEVGEQGTEGMYWDGKRWVVVPHDRWQKWKNNGGTPMAGMASGGSLGGANTGFQPQADGIQISPGGGWVTTAGPSNYDSALNRWYYHTATRQEIGGARRVQGLGAGGVGSGSGYMHGQGLNGGNNGGNNGGSQQAASIAAAAASSAAQAAASGVGSTAVTAAQNQSAQAIERASADAQRSAAELMKKIDQLIRKTIDKNDMTNAVKDAAAAIT